MLSPTLNKSYATIFVNYSYTFFNSLSTEIELNKEVMSWCGIFSDPGVSFFATSGRLHYALLIHANVSSGASFHARVEESYNNLDV